MEPPSAPPHKGCVPWQGLLLTASLLTSWNAPTTAQLTVEAVPPSAVEGRDVLLLAHNLPENQQGYRWFRGQGALDSHRIVAYVIATQAMIPGPAYSHRETVYPNGSLLLQNVTQKDAGCYTLQIINANLESREASGQFHVYQPVTQPSIQASNTTVPEENSVVLTCLSDDTGIAIQWILNNQSLQLPERMTLSQDHSTLSIDPIRREDAGDYQCEVSNPASSCKSDPLRLAVISKESAPGLSGWAIAGIVIGVFFGVTLLAALCCFLLPTMIDRYQSFTHLMPPRADPSQEEGGPILGFQAWLPRPPLPMEGSLSFHQLLPHQLLTPGCFSTASSVSGAQLGTLSLGSAPVPRPANLQRSLGGSPCSACSTSYWLPSEGVTNQHLRDGPG